MFNEESIAAARLAQIFGSELRRIDETTTAQAGSVGPATRLDPKQFIVQQGNFRQQSITPEQRKILEVVNREAESAYPTIPEAIYSQPPAQVISQQPIQPIGAIAQAPSPVSSDPQQLVFADFVSRQQTGSGDISNETLREINSNLKKLIDIVSRMEEKMFTKKSQTKSFE